MMFSPLFLRCFALDATIDLQTPQAVRSALGFRTFEAGAASLFLHAWAVNVNTSRLLSFDHFSTEITDCSSTT